MYIHSIIYVVHIYSYHIYIYILALDHTKILGNTVEEIAQKKAGIFKSNTYALVGPGCPNNVIEVRYVYIKF